MSTRSLAFVTLLHLLLTASVIYALGQGGAPAEQRLLNASHDPTRELFTEINRAFARRHEARTGQLLVIEQSHGGSGKQARSVIDGLEADIVTLALGHDIDAIAQAGLVPHDWREMLPHNAAPCTSTIVLVVRRGNPLDIRGWEDLTRPGVKVITPNPKTSGGARWNHLAAYGYARRRPGGEEAALEFMRRLYANVAVLDSGARGATTTFAQRGIGDVLISWENEAMLICRQFAEAGFEIVTPGESILAEPPVAVVESVARRRGTLAVAREYLEFLYTEEAQVIAARHFLRPRSVTAARAAGVAFPAVELFTVEGEFGGWARAQTEHFAEGGVFDRVFER